MRRQNKTSCQIIKWNIPCTYGTKLSFIDSTVPWSHVIQSVMFMVLIQRTPTVNYVEVIVERTSSAPFTWGSWTRYRTTHFQLICVCYTTSRSKTICILPPFIESLSQNFHVLHILLYSTLSSHLYSFSVFKHLQQDRTSWTLYFASRWEPDLFQQNIKVFICIFAIQQHPKNLHMIKGIDLVVL